MKMKMMMIIFLPLLVSVSNAAVSVKCPLTAQITSQAMTLTCDDGTLGDVTAYIGYVDSCSDLDLSIFDSTTPIRTCAEQITDFSSCGGADSCEVSIPGNKQIECGNDGSFPAKWFSIRYECTKNQPKSTGANMTGAYIGIGVAAAVILILIIIVIIVVVVRRKRRDDDYYHDDYEKGRKMKADGSHDSGVEMTEKHPPISVIEYSSPTKHSAEKPRSEKSRHRTAESSRGHHGGGEKNHGRHYDEPIPEDAESYDRTPDSARRGQLADKRADKNYGNVVDEMKRRGSRDGIDSDV